MNIHTQRYDSTQTHRALLFVLLAFALAALPLSLAAQEPEKEAEGVNRGNYNIKQSFEFGYRFSEFAGSLPSFRTFVYLTDGPRLLEHSLEMRSLNHTGSLFDNFSLHSFGYGGDPNAVSRLRMYKNKWYNFGATFRMNRNAWDYNLLVNPLNPVTNNPSFPITFSLHKMDLVRRMSDYNLTLMPQSRVRFRAGYSRNISEGPSFSTFHEGTDVLLYQDWKTSLNSYSFGVDIRVIPKTNISYDQFFHRYKGDTTWLNEPGPMPLGVPRFDAQLSNGSLVDLGVIFEGTAPCSGAITNPSTTPPTANAACNGYQFYGRAGNVRTNYPTEQLSFQSDYFESLDLSGRFSYTSADNDVIDYQEGFLGLATRTRQRVFGIDGPTSSKRVSSTFDFAATFQPKSLEKLRLVNTFHFTHFRNPGFFDMTECSLFPLSPSTGSLILNPAQYAGQTSIPPTCAAVLSLTGTSTTVGTVNHGSSSPADVANETFSTFLGQDTRQNQFEALYDFTPRIQGRLGYRFTKRMIRHSSLEALDLLYFPGTAARGSCATTAPTFPLCVTEPDGVSRRLTTDFEGEELETDINEHVALLGFSARPNDQWRFVFDMELASADRAYTRISPRQFQLYRFRTTYKPLDWFNLGFMFNILERRNNVAEILHKQHSRSFGFTAGIEPNANLIFDFGYDFVGIHSETNICFNLTGVPLPPGATACPIVSSAAPFQAVSLYENDISHGYFDLRWKPIKRLTTNLGYTITSASGDTLILSPVAPPGTLSYNYHKPYAGIEVDLTRGITGKAYWGYYGYNEKTPAGNITLPRDFRGNVVTLSVRYGF